MNHYIIHFYKKNMVKHAIPITQEQFLQNRQLLSDLYPNQAGGTTYILRIDVSKKQKFSKNH